MVKPKTRLFKFFKGLAMRFLWWIFPVLSLLTFVFSWAGLYPAELVERSYSRGIFPKISQVAAKIADVVPFSWLDLLIPTTAIFLVWLIRRRRWATILNSAAVLYLIFFWTWGLNYHRKPLNSKLQMDSTRMQSQAMTEFATHAVAELNRLYKEKQNAVYDEARTREEAVRRVRRVIALIDRSDWDAPDRIKTSWVGNPWLHAAGVDGVFNPFGQEPVISNTILDFERPFVISHELAHVRGYPDEGDANVIATFATLMSDDPVFQYSGWLTLWLYLRTADLEKLVDPGPREDIQRVFDRARREQIRWVNDFQRILLDWFLKANSVDEGVRSYSRVVLLASATEPFWSHFR
jgi:Protein of unknown function (DUF3810)